MGGKIEILTVTERSKVWMLDTFFRKEKDAKFHEIIQPYLYVRVFPDGDVLYSIRVRITSHHCHLASNLFLPEGFELAWYADSKVRRGCKIKSFKLDIICHLLTKPI